MLATEMAPLAKVGGLADVVGALSAALVRAGHDLRVVLPLYASIDRSRYRITEEAGVPALEVRGSGGGEGVRVLLVDSPEHFARPGIYNDPKDGTGYLDNADRFIAFQKQALAILKRVGFAPDVIHCHDHQTGLVPAWLEKDGAGTVFTIHNLGYQGLFPPETLGAAGFDRSLLYPMSPYEFYGQMNFMKIGISFADVITTVSPTYAKEICTPEQGCGLEGVLSSRREVLHGVLNGIDDGYWSPATDPHLAHHYDARSTSGKTKCRTELLARMELKPGRKRVPVIGIISRLTEQKGFDLIERALPALMQRDLKLVVLGAGEPMYAEMLRRARDEYPDKVAVMIGFDEGLAHLIEAGSDMFLMPSRYEPCGLNQMYSLAYGTVPIVRATGGLADTVNESNGFVFHDYDAAEMLAAIDRALGTFADRKAWGRLMRAGMTADYSWDRPAEEYARLYERAAERARQRHAGAASAR